MDLSSVDDTKVRRLIGYGVTTKRNSIMISDSEKWHDAPGHLRRDCSSTDPVRGVVLKTSDRKRSPRVNLAIREENVGWIHVPSTIGFVEDIDLRLRGDCSFWERAQAVFLDVILGQELRLNAMIVFGIIALEETYKHAYSQTRPRTHVRKGGGIPNSVQYWYCHESASGS